MNLKKEIWLEEDFKDFRLYLDSLAEASYQAFILKLIPNLSTCRGIRSPIMQKNIKDIQKGNWESFLNITPESYEERLVVASLLGKIPSFEQLLLKLEAFLPYVDNWAVCDTLAGSLRQFGENEEHGFEYATSLVHRKEAYSKRLGTVLLLIYYAKEPYMDAIIALVPAIQHEDYYVKMGVAWLVSKLYISDSIKTKVLFEGKLDAFTHSKSISKICDSFQISMSDKEIAKSYRKKR
ncbi:MAG: DNA alkylation repair protein [Bacilli bacterium]|nr:DNA alkylation repair protein [Bacilli bacterium]